MKTLTYSAGKSESEFTFLKSKMEYGTEIRVYILYSAGAVSRKFKQAGIYNISYLYTSSSEVMYNCTNAYWLLRRVES